MKDIINPVEYSKKAAEEYKALYGTDLVSIILYGSAAGGDFDSKRSDINLLIILSQMTPDLIAKSYSIQKKHLSQRFSRPLFMDKEYIEHSNDSYPMEFLDMKGCCKVLYGEDVLSSIAPDTGYLRLQIERELKGKWLHLLQEFAVAKKNKKHLLQLVQLSLKAYSPVFRALLRIKGVPVPYNRNDLFKNIESEYSMAGHPFQNITEACNCGNIAELEQLFIAYAKSIKNIIDTIDHIENK